MDSLATCPESPTDHKVYFTVNLAFVHYFENWTDADISIIDLSIIEEEEVLPITHHNYTLKNTIHSNQPTHLMNIIAQFKYHQSFF